jgi:hypothetical protein
MKKKSSLLKFLLDTGLPCLPISSGHFHRWHAASAQDVHALAKDVHLQVLHQRCVQYHHMSLGATSSIAQDASECGSIALYLLRLCHTR